MEKTEKYELYKTTFLLPVDRSGEEPIIKNVDKMAHFKSEELVEISEEDSQDMGKKIRDLAEEIKQFNEFQLVAIKYDISIEFVENVTLTKKIITINE